jgi:hypothetical protein
LCFKTHNGGKKVDVFSIDEGLSFSHGKSVSALITSNQVLGMTNGYFDVGDDMKNVSVLVKKEEGAFVGMFENIPIESSALARFCLSAREIDETSRPLLINSPCLKMEISANNVF